MAVTSAAERPDDCTLGYKLYCANPYDWENSDRRIHHPFMRFGDKVGIEMNDAQGKSIFGRIENTVEKY